MARKGSHLALSETPPRAKIRAWKYQGRHYVLERDGEGWESIVDFDNKDDALEVIEQHFADKDARWSLDVKANAGWRCQAPCCEIGTFNKKLLQAHHVKPKEKFRQFRHDLENGKCLCIYHHGLEHTGWVRMLIWARMGLLLLGGLFPNKRKEISRITL